MATKEIKRREKSSQGISPPLVREGEGWPQFFAWLQVPSVSRKAANENAAIIINSTVNPINIVFVELAFFMALVYWLDEGRSAIVTGLIKNFQLPQYEGLVNV